LREPEEQRTKGLKRFNDDANSHRLLTRPSSSSAFLRVAWLAYELSKRPTLEDEDDDDENESKGVLYGTNRILSDLSPFFIISRPSLYCSKGS
jgi:hypothetical protein